MDERRYYCSECGEELSYRDEIFTGDNTDVVVGCSQCIKRHNAIEWLGDEEDIYEYEHDEH